MIFPDFPEWHPLYRKEPTTKDLVAFEGNEFRVPSRLIQALAELYRAGILLRPAKVRLDEDGPERTLFVTLKVSPRRLQDASETDAIYEIVEGATTSKLAVHASLIEQSTPYRRSLALETSELGATQDLPDSAMLDEEEAWLLLTKADIFDEHQEATDAALDAWKAKHSQKVEMQHVVVREEERKEYHGLQVADGATLGQTRVLAESLPYLVTVYLTAKALRPPRPSTGLYESTREMAQRLKPNGGRK